MVRPEAAPVMNEEENLPGIRAFLESCGYHFLRLIPQTPEEEGKVKFVKNLVPPPDRYPRFDLSFFSTSDGRLVKDLSLHLDRGPDRTQRNTNQEIADEIQRLLQKLPPGHFRHSSELEMLRGGLRHFSLFGNAESLKRERKRRGMNLSQFLKWTLSRRRGYHERETGKKMAHEKRRRLSPDHLQDLDT